MTFSPWDLVRKLELKSRLPLYVLYCSINRATDIKSDWVLQSVSQISCVGLVFLQSRFGQSWSSKKIPHQARVWVWTLSCQPSSNHYASFYVFQWELICSRKHLKALSQAAYLAGLLIGSFAFSSISDHFGRKIAVFLSIAFLVSTTINNLIQSLHTKGIVTHANRLWTTAVVISQSIERAFVGTFGASWEKNLT